MERAFTPATVIGLVGVVAVVLIVGVVSAADQRADHRTDASTDAAGPAEVSGDFTAGSSAGPGGDWSPQAVQSNLRNALTAAKAVYTDGADYREADVAMLSQVEPSLVFFDGVARSDWAPGYVYVESNAEGTAFCASAVADTGEVFVIQGTVAAGTTYARGDAAPATCTGTPLSPSW